jgi:hypothetical protein
VLDVVEHPFDNFMTTSSRVQLLTTLQDVDSSRGGNSPLGLGGNQWHLPGGPEEDVFSELYAYY